MSKFATKAASNMFCQAKMFPVIKKNAVVDVMKYTETVNGKKWYFIRIPHPTEGFVREFVPAGYFKKLI